MHAAYGCYSLVTVASVAGTVLPRGNVVAQMLVMAVTVGMCAARIPDPRQATSVTLAGLVVTAVLLARSRPQPDTVGRGRIRRTRAARSPRPRTLCRTVINHVIRKFCKGAAIAAGSGAVRPKNGWVCDRRGKSVMYGAAAQSRVTT